MDRLLTKDAMSFINAGMPSEAKYGEVFAEIAKAQDSKTAKIVREETLKEVGDWLYTKYKSGWYKHSYTDSEIAPEPEIFQLVFYWEEIAKLKQGILGDNK
jgi:hypothetical protein